MDPLEAYVKNNALNIDEVPFEVMKSAFIHFGHRVEDDFVYGVKLVSLQNQDMFKANTYEVGKVYEYEESDDTNSAFDQYDGPCGVHSAGIWSHGAIPKHVKIYPNVTLCKPILVRYKITEAMPIGTTIKGKRVEIVSHDYEDVKEYLME